MNRGRELTKNTLIITVGRVSTQFVSFLLLRLYTDLLTKKEYGTVDLITTFVQLLIPITSLMLDQGVFRYLLNCNTYDEKKRIISSSFLMLLVTNALVLALGGMLAIYSKDENIVWLTLILIVTAFVNFFLQIARGVHKTELYAIGSFTIAFDIIVLNILFVAVLRYGPRGMFLATLLGNFLGGVFVFFRLNLIKYLSFFKFDRNILKQQLRYSLPLVPNQLSIWVMNSSDRIIVTAFLGTAANGVLAVTHKFPAIFISFFNIFLLAWQEMGAIHYFDEDRDEFFSLMFHKIMSLFTLLNAAILITMPIIFRVLINVEYSEAYNNVPIYLIAGLFNVVIGLLGVVYVATKRTTEIAKTTIFSAIINIIVNLILIKSIGLYAASISTFLGYFLTMVYRILDVKKYLKIEYSIKKIGCMCFYTCIACAIFYANNVIISLITIPFMGVIAFFMNKEIANDVVAFVSSKISRECIKKYKHIVRALIIVLGILYTIICTFFVIKKYRNNVIAVQDNYKVQKSLSPQRIIPFSTIGTSDFTCTGIAYDTIDDCFWIADNGSNKSNRGIRPRLVKIDKELSNVNTFVSLNIAESDDYNLQGIAFDKCDNALWLAVGDSVLEVEKNGKVKKRIDLKEYAQYKANGVCVNEKDKTIWVLCYSRFLLHYTHDGILLKRYNCNLLGQDHVFTDGERVFITAGVDYNGENNFVCEFDIVNGIITHVFRVKKSYAIEGLLIKDSKMFIVNDGLYHKARIPNSYISIYNFKETEIVN